MEMRSLEDVRRLLGPEADGLSDEQIAQIRAGFYESALAWCREYRRMQGVGGRMADEETQEQPQGDPPAAEGEDAKTDQATEQPASEYQRGNAPRRTCKSIEDRARA